MNSFVMYALWLEQRFGTDIAQWFSMGIRYLLGYYYQSYTVQCLRARSENLFMYTPRKGIITSVNDLLMAYTAVAFKLLIQTQVLICVGALTN